MEVLSNSLRMRKVHVYVHSFIYYFITLLKYLICNPHATVIQWLNDEEIN